MLKLTVFAVLLCVPTFALDATSDRPPKYVEQEQLILRDYQQVVVQIQKSQPDPDKAASEIAKAKLDYDAKMAALNLEYNKWSADETRKLKAENVAAVEELLATARKWRDAKDWVKALLAYKSVVDNDAGTLLATTAVIESREMMKIPEAKEAIEKVMKEISDQQQRAETQRQQAECKRCLKQAKMLVDNGSKDGAIRLLAEYVGSKPGAEFESQAQKMLDELKSAKDK